MSEDAHLQRILFRAERFRRAIEVCERSRLPVTFKEFPRGSCGDVSPILGTYLKESGFGSFDYVQGSRADLERPGAESCSYAWLSQGDIVVDITADQFPDAPAPIIVTRDSDWHRGFSGKIQHEVDYRVYGDGFARRNLESAHYLRCRSGRSLHSLGSSARR
jgi:hypothetical protein